MKKVLTLFTLLITIIACEKSDMEILEKTITVLDEIEKVRYKSNLRASEGGTIYLDKTDTLFFDFKTELVNLTPRYFLNDSVGELIFDGKNHIQSLSRERVTLTDDSANPNNPLMITLFPIKVFLPKLIANQDVSITRKTDSLNKDLKNYVFEIIVKKGYLDWEKLEINNSVSNDSKYILTISKSNYLPIKFQMQNGESGTFSRTLEDFDFSYTPSEELWTGSHIPEDYTKMTFTEYQSIQRENFKNLQESTSSTSDKKLNLVELPNLENNSIVKLSSHKGDLVLLEFWFKFCGPCVQAVPKLNAIYEKYKDQDFVLYGIEFKQDFDQQNLREYVKKIKMNYPSLYQGKKIADELGVTAAPSFVILDRDGKIIYVEARFNEEEINKVLKENL